MTTPTVTTTELGAIEEVLDMGGGYVLSFSNRTFSMFMADLEVEVEAEELGRSKANRLRELLRAGAPTEVARVLSALLDHRGERDGDDTSRAVARYKAVVSRLEGISVVVSAPDSRDHLTMDYVRELEGKANKRLAAGDLEGAITVARTLLEAVLQELELRLLGVNGDHKGDLQRQYKAVAKELRIDDQRTDIDDSFKQIARGLVQIVNGVAAIRNKLSDGHARKVKPDVRHARVAVNAANTVSGFLVEVYIAQTHARVVATGVEAVS